MMQSVAAPGLLTSVPTIDEVLHDHASELGDDFTAYRNHQPIASHRRIEGQRICSETN